MMADLHDRFRSLDRIAVPNLWADVEQRAVAATPKPFRPVGGSFALVMALAALIVLLFAIALAIVGGERTPQVQFSSPLVFTTSAGGRGVALYAVDGAGLDPRAIMEGSASKIQVSPDGQYVLFEGAGPGLTLSRMDGSSSRTFPDGAWTATWAPDSHAVAMVTNQGDRMILVIADVDGGDPRRIEVPVREEPQLAWSPDTAHLAYTGFEPGNPLAECQTIASMLVVDINSRAISEYGPLYPATLPVWSHDGRQLAAAASPIGLGPPPCNVSGEGLILVSLRIATGEVTVMTAPEPAASSISLAWSADDRSVLWQIAPFSGGVDIARVPTEGGATKRLAHLAPRWPVGSFFQRGAVWSPDGSHLAWTELDEGSTDMYSLWVMDLADGRPRRIAQDVLGYVGSAVSPLWASEGAWIAFFRQPADPANAWSWMSRINGEGSIWIIRPDGTDERLVVGTSLRVDADGVDW